MARYELKGKTVVMTGASGGIGSEAAEAFARRGAVLVLSGRNREALARAAEKVKAAGSAAHAVPADVTRREEVEALVAKALELTGRLDVMMLGAGYGVLGAVENVTPELWRMQMEVNFFGALHGFYAALPHFLKQGHGRYIIMNSLSGRMAMGLSAPYSASKFALWGFTDCVRSELHEKNISLLAVYPYFVKTSFQANIQSPDLNVPGDLAGRMFGQSPQKLAEQIVRACEKGREEILSTALGKIGVRVVPLSYHLSEWFRRRLLPFTRKILRAR
jgi:NAD(P)-dependent dehydrogenase (short-subunit alcohol dehydrogenase family)